MSSAERARGRAGFTLVELLVAVVLAGILAGVIFQLIQGQSRFVALQSAQEEAQQNARGSLELISSELRAIPPGGLVSANASDLTFFLPRAWGLVCQRYSDTSMDVMFPSSVTADMLALTSGSGLMGDIGAGGVRNWQPTASLGSTRATVSATAAISSASGPCATLRASSEGDTVDVVARRLTGANFPAVTQGSLVYLYQVVRYTVSQTDGQWWIQRSNGLSGSTPTMQPLAGPLQGSTGLLFRYFTANGAALAAPGTNAAQLATVARVQVRVGTQGRSGLGVGTVTQTDSTTVYLRNR